MTSTDLPSATAVPASAPGRAAYPHSRPRTVPRWWRDASAALLWAVLLWVTALWVQGGGLTGIGTPAGLLTSTGRLTGLVASALLLVQNQRTDLARLEAAVERVALAVERQGGGSTAPGAALQGYVVAGGSSYHLPNCTLPEARTEAHMIPLTDVVGSALEPCRVCRPPQFGRLVNGAVPPAPTASV